MGAGQAPLIQRQIGGHQGLGAGQGNLFFGTADQLFSELEEDLDRRRKEVPRLLLDAARSSRQPFVSWKG